MGRWDKKIVVVAGGSAGLGLAVAREFGRRGATPVLLSRSSDNLIQAVAVLQADAIVAESHVTDVLDEVSVKQAAAAVLAQHGGVDVLVNSVGQSTRIELEQATPRDYREFIEWNLISAVNCTRAFLPAVQARGGHIVNIGSLSSKSAWPFLAPYTVSKFALAGYTQQLQVEGPTGVHCMLVCPGPIRRPDSGQRYRQGGKRLPERALQPGAGAQIDGLDAAYVARKIVRGCERRKLELVLSWRARLLFWISTVSPRLANAIVRRLSGAGET